MTRYLRGKFEILYEILYYCRTPSLKTHIMYRSNLNHKQTTKYIKLAIDIGLLRIALNDDRQVELTQKGFTFISYMISINKLVSGTEIELP